MVVRSNDTDLSQLLYMVGCDKIQLSYFQRSWVCNYSVVGHDKSSSPE